MSTVPLEEVERREALADEERRREEALAKARLDAFLRRAAEEERLRPKRPLFPGEESPPPPQIFEAPPEFDPLEPPSLIEARKRSVIGPAFAAPPPAQSPRETLSGELLRTVGAIFPETTELSQFVEALRADPKFIREQLHQAGRSPDTEALLTLLGVSPESIEEFYQDTPTPEETFAGLVAAALPDTTPRAVLEVADLDPSAFVDRLRLGGMTREKQALLRQMGFSWEEIQEVFRFQRLDLPFNGVRQLITVETATLRAYDAQGRRVGSYNTATGEFDSLPIDGQWKDILDRARYGAAGQWNRSKGFFLSTFPNLFLPDIPDFERRFLPDGWVDTHNARQQELRDRYRELYARNRLKYEDWLDKNLDKLPHPNRQKWEEGIFQHPELIVDPGYFAYTAAGLVPMMVGSIGVGLAATAATGNPLVGLAAAGAVQIPSETDAIRRELLANGMSEANADRLALAAGMLIGALEGLGNLPIMKAVSPLIVKHLRQKTGEELARLTARQLAKRGARIFTEVELAETLTEVMQEAVSNAAIKVANEDQSIFANLDKVAASTLVGVIPFAALGGGASMVRVAPSRTQGLTDAEMVAKGWSRDRARAGAIWYEKAQPAVELEVPKIPGVSEAEIVALIQERQGAAVGEAAQVAVVPAVQPIVQAQIPQTAALLNRPVRVEEVPILTAQLKAVHREVQLDIATLRDSIRKAVQGRDITARLQNMVLKGAVSELAEAGRLVRRIEAGEELTANEIAGLNLRIVRLQAQSQALREKAETQAEQRQALVSYIRSNVPLAARGKLLASVKNVRTPQGLLRAIARAEAAAESFNQKALRVQVREELAKAKPAVKGAILRGKFTPETQRQLDAIAAIVGKDRGEAVDEIATNIGLANAGEMDFILMAERNELLTHQGIDGMSAAELQNVLENVQAIKDTGRSLRRQQQEATKERLDAERADAIAVVTGGNGLKPANVSLSPKENELARSFFGDLLDKGVNSQLAWDSKLDKLSHNWKSKPFESPLSRFGRAVHEARTREFAGQEASFAKVRKGLEEVFGTSKTAVLNQALNHMQHDTVNLGPFTNRNGQPTTLRATKAQLIKTYMELQDPTLDIAFTEGMAWTPEMKEAIGKALTPQERAWGDWHLQFYREDYESINPVYGEVYFTDLQRNNFYSPVRRELDLTKDAEGKDVLESQLRLQDSARYASVLNNSLKARVANQRPLRNQDANAVLQNHIIQMEHFKAWAATIRDMRGVFGDRDFRTAVRQYHGTDILRSLDRDLNMMAQGGRDAAGVNSLLDGIRGRFSVAVLGLKPRIVLGQVTSLPSYLTQMPVGDFFTGVADFWKSPLANAQFLWENSPFYRARFTQGPERDVRLAMTRTPVQQLMQTSNLPRKFLLGIRMGDRISVTQGMWAAYQSGLQRGLPPEAAMRGAEQATRMSQDTSEIETLSALQNGPSWVKLLTMFQNQPNKYFRIMADNARNVRYGRGRADKAVFNLVLLWVVLPALFQLTVDGFEFKTERQMRAWLLGPINSLLIAGQVAQSIYGWFTDEPHDIQVTPVFQTLVDLKNGVTKALKVMGQIDNPYVNMSVDDLVAAIESFAKAGGEATGLPTPYLVQAERAIREGEPKELVFTRWGLRPTDKNDQDKAKELGDNLSQTLQEIALASGDVEVRKKAQDVAKERRERLAGGLTVEPEPTLDMAKLDSEFQRLMKDTLPDDIAQDKRFSALARAWAAMSIVRAQADTLPDRQLHTINTDPMKDDTILEYRKQWQAREKITDLAKLREFDQVFPLAHLGNVTAQQLSLMKQYMAAKDKAAFLEAHPELRENPRTKWLRAHPLENARLALWGNAHILSQGAYDEFRRLMDTLDIPEEALPPTTLPPAASVTTHFKYLAEIEKSSAQSWEAQLLLADDDAYRQWRGFEPVEPGHVYATLIKWRDVQAQYDALDAEDAEGRRAFRNAHRDWADDLNWIEIIRWDKALPDRMVAAHIAYSALVDDHGAGSAEVMLWRADDPTGYDALRTDVKLKGKPWALEPIDRTRIPIWRIDVQYREEDAQYNEGIPDRLRGIANQNLRDDAIRMAREKYLAANPTYRKGRREREAYGMGMAPQHIKDYVALTELPEKGFRQERWLKDHPAFYKEVWLAAPDAHGMGNSAVDFGKIPDAQYDLLYEKWRPQMEAYYEGIEQQVRLLVGELKSSRRRQLRDALFARNSGFFQDRIRYEAYGDLVPGVAIPGYVAYYATLYKGKPAGWERWWEDDRVLRDNPAFYAYARRVLGWEERDFTKIPSRAFEVAYNTAYIPQDARGRTTYRRRNSAFDAEGARIGLWKPLEEAKPDEKTVHSNRVSANGHDGQTEIKSLVRTLAGR